MTQKGANRTIMIKTSTAIHYQIFKQKGMINLVIQGKKALEKFICKKNKIFLPPILEHVCHFLCKLPIWVSFCPDGVSFCPEYHLQPLFFTQPSHTMYLHKTLPRVPTPPQNTLFPGLYLIVGKMNYCLGKWTLTGENV